MRSWLLARLFRRSRYQVRLVGYRTGDQYSHMIFTDLDEAERACDRFNGPNPIHNRRYARWELVEL